MPKVTKVNIKEENLSSSKFSTRRHLTFPNVILPPEFE